MTLASVSACRLSLNCSRSNTLSVDLGPVSMEERLEAVYRKPPRL